MSCFPLRVGSHPHLNKVRESSVNWDPKERSGPQKQIDSRLTFKLQLTEDRVSQMEVLVNRSKTLSLKNRTAVFHFVLNSVFRKKQYNRGSRKDQILLQLKTHQDARLQTVPKQETTILNKSLKKITNKRLKINDGKIETFRSVRMSKKFQRRSIPHRIKNIYTNKRIYKQKHFKKNRSRGSGDPIQSINDSPKTRWRNVIVRLWRKKNLLS